MWKDIHNRMRTMRTLATIPPLASLCVCVALAWHTMACAEERKVWITGEVKEYAIKTISDGDSIERILEKAGGPLVLKDGTKVPLRYVVINKNRSGPDKKNRVIVKKRDWHRKISEFSQLDAIVDIYFVDPDAYLREMDDAKSTDQSKQPPTPAPREIEKPSPPGAPTPSGTQKPEKSQPPVEQPAHPTGGNGGPDPTKLKQAER